MELAALKQSLLFFHVSELRELAEFLSLESFGNKMGLILRVLHYLETGEKLKVLKFPKESCAKKGENYSLQEQALMVKGAYKNDLKTRLFFQKIIGSHFHFTAFGIDWLNERWLKGSPPTYKEFAEMWQEEYQRRKISPASPKEEWAYIRFIQAFVRDFPEASRESAHKAWNEERERHKTAVYTEVSSRTRLLADS